MTLTVEQAEAMLPVGDPIHTFVQAEDRLFGAYRTREEVLALIRAATAIFPGTEQAREWGYGMAVLVIGAYAAALAAQVIGIPGRVTMQQAQELADKLPAVLRADYNEITEPLRPALPDEETPS